MGIINSKVIKKRIGKYILLGKLLVNDRKVPRISKIILGFALLYHFTPLDIIPDFIPFFGQLDDIIFVPALIFLAIKFVPKKVFLRNYRKVFGK
ncbi:MAG: DUF1232 domain-containing protein [Nanoarchaeota archaeon]|nr:DUF1232 domain-containing protein [Nanoarchaeota archaeon]